MPSFPRFGVCDLRGWWINSSQLPVNSPLYPVQAHRDLAARDTNEMGKYGLAYRCNFYIDEIDANNDGVASDWKFADAMFKTASVSGIPAILPIVRSTNAPVDDAGRTRFAAVVKELINRYKAGGSYWVANPSLKPVPLTAIEVWNEPNLASYWNAGGAFDYGRLLGKVWFKAQEAQAGFAIIHGGVADGVSTTKATNGANEILRPGQWVSTALSGAHQENLSSQDFYYCVKGIAFHAYGATLTQGQGTPWSVGQAQANFDQFRNDLISGHSPVSGQAVPPIWITEFGWRRSPTNVTGSPANTYSQDELLIRYRDLVGWLLAKPADVVGPIFSYAYRMGGSGLTLDDGFGWNDTAGSTGGGDNSQAQVGVQKPYGTWFAELGRQAL